MADTYLICEGHANSVDLRLLDMIVAQRLCPGLSIKVVPSGGDSGLNAVRFYHEQRSRRVQTRGSKRGKLGHPDDKAFSIQDRNFRSRAEADGSWLSINNKSLIWRRHEIENYLLAPSVVLEAFNVLRASPKYKNSPGVEKIPVGESEVSSLLRDIAKPLLENHAGEVLRYELDVALKQSRAFAILNSSTNIGDWTRTQWLTHLHLEGQRIQCECNTVINLPDLTPAAIDQRYDAIFARVGAPAFLASGTFLEEMGGHELMSGLVKHLHSLGKIKIGTAELEEVLLQAFGNVYQPGFFAPDDFDELATKLR